MTINDGGGRDPTSRGAKNEDAIDESPTSKKKTTNTLRRQKRPRRRSADDADDRTFRLLRCSLRLPTSRVAALTGLHPYADLPRIVLDLVYQGRRGRSLLERDASLLGLTLASDEEVATDLAARAGADASRAVRELLRDPVAEDVESARRRKEETLRRATKSGTLTADETRFLREVVRKTVDASFGTTHENDALDLYEKTTGWEVRQRNERIRDWHFRRDDAVLAGVAPTGPAIDRPPRRREEANEEDDSDSAEQEKGEKDEVLPSPKDSSQKDAPPYFTLSGAVDGVRDELWFDSTTKSNDDDGWSLRPVVVECKHRMNRIIEPPPLYDQIQAVVYCLMYEVEHADIVQVVRTTKEREPKRKERKIASPAPEDNHDTKGAASKSNVESAKDRGSGDEKTERETVGVAAKDDDGDVVVVKNEAVARGVDKRETSNANHRSRMAISRVSLRDDPLFHHHENFHRIVLVRLASMVEAVYSIRSSDDKRYRFLVAAASPVGGNDDTAAWRMLFDECPWLSDCDVAFHRADER